LRAKNHSRIWLSFLPVLLFSFFLFNHIAYPLLWNDESDTAFYAERVLDYGFPKIHDGKNILNQFSGNKNYSINKTLNAYIGCMWGQYYFGSIGAYFARFHDDYYVKTALLRIPFALAGLFAVLWLGAIPFPFFKTKNEKQMFFILFIIFELFSFPLLLHMRQARYYSLCLILLGFFLWTCSRYFFLNRLSYRTFFVCMLVFSILSFNIFYPLLAALFFAVVVRELHNIIGFFSRNASERVMDPYSPVTSYQLLFTVFIATVSVLPCIIFFQTNSIGKSLVDMFGMTMKTYWLHLYFIGRFFLKNDYLFCLLVIKTLLVILKRKFLFIESQKASFPLYRFSCFLTWLFAFSSLFIASSPLMFERYIIWLQPLLPMIILLDVFYIYQSALCPASLPLKIKKIIIFCFTFLVFLNIGMKTPSLRNYWYEMIHVYKGPLDYVIPYIKNNYPLPEKLIIATNFEESSYMYYLHAKIIDFWGSNWDKNQKEPDIVIYRKGWNPQHSISSEFWQLFDEKTHWDKLLFPVYDYFCNNSPESQHHLFQTRLPSYETQSVELIEKRSK
jgi:hypothetical protein